MTESQNPQGAIPLDAIKTASEVITPSLSNQTPVESRVPGVPTAEHEESPESAKKTAGVFIRDIVIAGWRPNEITDPIISQRAQDTINALASLDQMDQEITDSGHPDRKTPNPLYRPGANYGAVTGKYVCIGPNGVKIEGVAGLQTSIVTLRAIADTESVDQVKRTGAEQLAEALEKQLGLQQVQTPETAAQTASPVEKPTETGLQEMQQKIAEICGISDEKSLELYSTWESWFRGGGNISTERLLKQLEQSSSRPKNITEKLTRLKAARELYISITGRKDVPPMADENALLKIILNSIDPNDPTLMEKLKKNFGGTLDILRSNRGQTVLQLLMVLGSLMSSFASTAEEAAK